MAAADFETLADATVRIDCGGSSGSGFHFLRPEIIVTADHVVEGNRNAVETMTEDGSAWNLRYLAHSPESDYDFAIFEVDGKVPANRTTLLPPDQPQLPSRGTDVGLAGFPHGIPDLLVQRGIVAGPNADQGFYVDAPVNAGNSGGPVIDTANGSVIGGNRSSSTSQAWLATCKPESWAWISGASRGWWASRTFS